MDAEPHLMIIPRPTASLYPKSHSVEAAAPPVFAIDDLRHVTLAAASLGYALDARQLYGQLNLYETILAFSGIAMVGVLNIFTSFVLSFLLAVRARNIGEEQSHRFLREVRREFLANPLAFILPRH